MTATDGTGVTTITAGMDTGVSTLEANSTVSYYTFWIYAEAGGVSELAKGPLKTKSITGTTALTITGRDISGLWFGGVTWHLVEGDHFYTGSITFNNDGTCQGHEGLGDGQPGTWSISGLSVTIIWNSGAQYNGELDANLDTMSGTGVAGTTNLDWDAHK